MQDFEKLGVFYLGREYDLKAGKPKDNLVLYDSKDLVTHAICVGMTGSGKTGLCLAVLEEAAIDNVPAIVIDPKGDLSNLLLTFPDLKPDDFAPWVNPNEAKSKGLSVDDFAKDQATRWKQGLAEWGEDGERIRRMREAAEVSIYTPGSNAGLSVSIMKSFARPEQEILDDKELLRERISTTATSLLGLMGIDADPLQSREHILISTILNNLWQSGKDLDLAALIHLIQDPPFNRVGVLDLESYFPEKDRFSLAMRLNNLLAAPGFEAWLEGAPLDIQNLLHQPDGKSRIAIFSIAHLNDSERMFFVSLLLNQVLGWVRSQPGTTSLRAIVYMDEIFGYFPPVANPPSKAPLLTLLKQARAFGVGVMLATQNPVDIDYKGLANAGTWFLGRLQTERDKMRVLEGLEGAAANTATGFDRGSMEQMLAGLSNRVFIMNNVHEKGPVVFQVRWALSYLAGPLTRNQIKKLMDPVRAKLATPGTTPTSNKGMASPVLPSPGAKQAGGQASTANDAPTGLKDGMAADGTPPVAEFAPPPKPKLGQRPLLPPEIPQFFLPVRSKGPTGSQLVFRPMIFGCAQVFFSDSKSGTEHTKVVSLLTAVTTGAVAVDWMSAASVELTDSELDKSPPVDGAFDELPPDCGKVKNYEAWKKTFADALYRMQKLEVFKSPGLKEYSKPNESEREFRLRLQQASREERDLLVAKVRQKYATKHAGLQEKVRKAQQAVEREKQQASQSWTQTAISVGTTVFGAILGRKAVSAGTIGKATTAARGASRAMKESGDVGRAQENVTDLEKQLADLEEQIKTETDNLAAKVDPMTDELETITIKPKKTNVAVRLVTLAWAPHWQHADGTLTTGWE